MKDIYFLATYHSLVKKASGKIIVGSLPGIPVKLSASGRRQPGK
jgi:hypothetical protein